MLEKQPEIDDEMIKQDTKLLICFIKYCGLIWELSKIYKTKEEIEKNDKLIKTNDIFLYEQEFHFFGNIETYPELFSIFPEYIKNIVFNNCNCNLFNKKSKNEIICEIFKSINEKLGKFNEIIQKGYEKQGNANNNNNNNNDDNFNKK